MQSIEWRPVVGLEGRYEVSNTGLVKSLARNVPRKDGRRHYIQDRILRPGKDNHHGGHQKVSLGDIGGQRTRPVHRLVAEAFLGAPKHGQEVRHLDGNPDNNCVENLRWGTHAENMQDMRVHGTHYFGRKTQCKWGHPFDELNTIYRPSGGRKCRTCTREEHHRRRQNLMKIDAAAHKQIQQVEGRATRASNS